jgi:hypothetical protein
MKQLFLSTKSAFALVRGRPASEKHNGIYGLFKFASITSTVWNEASFGHPYAISFLARVSWFLTRSGKTMEDFDLRYDHDKSTLLQMQAVFSEPPVQIPKKIELNFANPYAYHAAYLLQRFDETLQMLDKLLDRGIIQRKIYSQEEKILSRQIRAIFHSVADYRHGLVGDLATCKKAMGPLEKINPFSCNPLYQPNIRDHVNSLEISSKQ